MALRERGIRPRIVCARDAADRRSSIKIWRFPESAVVIIRYAQKGALRTARNVMKEIIIHTVQARLDTRRDDTMSDGAHMNICARNITHEFKCDMHSHILGVRGFKKWDQQEVIYAVILLYTESHPAARLWSL